MSETIVDRRLYLARETIVEMESKTIIKNFKDLATNRLRIDALAIIEAGFAAIDTEKVIGASLKLYQDNLLVVKDT